MKKPTPKTKPTKHRPNKQAEVTAASFKRLAKAVRDISDRSVASWAWHTFAKALNAEAARLRRKP